MSHKQRVNELIAEAYEIRNRETNRSSELCREALALAEQNHFIKGKADALCQLGFNEVQVALFQDAIDHLNVARDLYTWLNDETGLGNVNYNLGLVFIRLGDLTNALEYELKSLNFRERSADENGIANCLMQIAYIYENFNDLDKALEYYSRSLELHRKLNNTSGMATAHMGLGSVYIIKRDEAKVIENLEASIRERDPEKDPRGNAASLHRYSTWFVQTKEFGKAKDVIEKGLKLARIAGDRMGETRFLILLGQLLIDTEMIDEAIRILNSAEKLKSEIKLKSIEYEIHLALSEAYSRKKDFENALIHYKQFHQSREDVMSNNAAVKARNMEIVRKMEVAEKETEIHRLKNVELKKAYEEIEQKNKDITDSIHYAKRIQQSLLPMEKYIERKLNELLPCS